MKQRLCGIFVEDRGNGVIAEFEIDFWGNHTEITVRAFRRCSQDKPFDQAQSRR